MPEQQITFHASSDSYLEVFSPDMVTALVDDRIPCQELQIDKSKLENETPVSGIPVGISTNIMPKLPLVEAVRCFYQYGFNHVELQLEYRSRFDYTRPEVERFLQKCKWDSNMNYTVHAPYLKTNLAADDEELRRRSCLQVITLIPFCVELEVKCLTVHTGGRGVRSLEQLWRSLDELVSQAQKYGISICLENTGSDRPGWLLLSEQQCVNACDRTGCLLTIDLVHVFSLSSDPVAVLEKLLPFAGNCHLADTQGHQHLHLPLGWGNLPISQILAVLKQRRYKGKVIVDAIEQGYRTEAYLESAVAFRDGITSY